MTKEETLVQLHAAKKAHITWVNRAKALIDGLPIQKEQVPVDCTACQFGQWFYSDAQKLKAIPNMDNLKLIEEEHFQLHDIYMKIFKIYFKDENMSFISKLFGSKKKVTADQKAEAEAYFVELKESSKKLLNLIEKLEKRIRVIADERFSS